LIFIVYVALVVGVIAFIVILFAFLQARSREFNETGVVEIGGSNISIETKQKLQNLPIKKDAMVLEAISNIVEEETTQQLNRVKQELATKFKVVLDEKNREIEIAKREISNVEERAVKAEQMSERIESEKKTTDAVVRSIADGLVVVNQKGEVLLMNPAAEKILGRKQEKKVGQSIYQDAGDELMISMTKENEDKEKVIEYTSKNENTKKVIRSSTAVIQNEDGQTIGMVNVLTDITKQKEFDELKAAFLSNVTHELRTPIVAMQKAIALLMDQSAAGPLNENQANFLRIVSRNAAQLSRLVEDLLDMAKIDSGKLRLQFIPVQIGKLINEAIDTLDTWAKSKNIQIVREIDATMPEIKADPGRITQVMNNLLSNAVKFTPPGGKITVKSSCFGGTSIETSVTDTGAGMKPDNLKKLFKRFEQFGDQQGIQGTGLGLCISKDIVERHGGRIFAESKGEGQGSTFTFTLPIQS